MRPVIAARSAAVCLVLLPGWIACGASKSDFINDDPRLTTADAGGTSSSAGGASSSTHSGATNTTSGAGGTGGSGSATTASNGGAASTSSSTTGRGGAGGVGGVGGVGGAPGRSCNEDADCGLATNLAACCADCTGAHRTDVIESDPCLVGKGENDTDECEKPVCTDVACPTIACEQPVAAVCEGGQCTATHECPEGLILDKGSCVPKCATDADCVVATRAGECCAGCPDAYHRQALEEDPCLVPSGKPAPPACKPDPQECALVLCPEILCLGPGSPVCDEQGRCAQTNAFTE